MSDCFCTRGINPSVHLLFLYTPASHRHTQAVHAKNREAGEASAALEHFSHRPVKGRQSGHMRGTWPLLQDSTASPLGSSIRPTRCQAGGSANGSEWRTCLRPAETIHTSSFGVTHCDVQINTAEYIGINNNHGKPGQPAMKVTRYAIHSDSIQLRQA